VVLPLLDLDADPGRGGAPPRPAERLRADLRWADVCVVEFPWQFGFCRRERPDRPVVYVAHNVEEDARGSGARGMGLDPQRSRFVRYVARLEREALAAADLVVAVSPEDRTVFLEKHHVQASRLALVPNGSDTESFTPVGPEEKRALRRQLGLPERPTVLYVAAIPKPPDRVGLAWVKRVAARLPELGFLVVGGVVPGPFIEGNVVATGLVDEVVPYFQAADVALCPIEHGGGTKIKVWDSLAAGLPTVVFAETVRNTLQHGEHVWIAEKGEEELVTAIRTLVEDRDLAVRLGGVGRAFVEAHHDWRDIAGGLEASLLSILRS
jgi:glycosyltransferase involved in cell wall biosynthesis